jgi:antitoxin VapB
MRTRLLKRGKYQVVRVPPELRFDPVVSEVDIERVGDDLIVRAIKQPTRRPLAHVLENFRAFSPGLADEIRDIGERCASLPVLDERAADEILDYDENGIPRGT